MVLRLPLLAGCAVCKRLGQPSQLHASCQLSLPACLTCALPAAAHCKLQGSSEEDGSDLEEGEEEEEEGEEDEAAHRAMLEAVTGGDAAAARKRRRAKEVVVTEAYPEAAYNLPAAGECNRAQALHSLLLLPTLALLHVRASTKRRPFPAPKGGSAAQCGAACQLWVPGR